MPFTWRINITPHDGGPATFEFEQTPDIRPGDSIVWRNDDAKAHFPTPDDGSFEFMGSQIAPGSSSTAFAPSKAREIKYHCSLPGHEDETGTITVTAPPKDLS